MKELRIPLLAAAAGVLLLLLLFPRADPTAAYRATIDRSTAIQRARELSSRYGVDTSHWKVAATGLTDDKLRAYLFAHPNDAAAKLFTPLAWGVLFTGPRKETARVKLFADGRPAEWELKQAAEPKGAAPPFAPDAMLADFTEAASASFQKVKEGTTEETWHWQYPAVADLTVTERGGRVLAAALSPIYASGFRYDTNPKSIAIPAAIARILQFFGFCVALFLAVRACFRGWIPLRVPAALAALLAVWVGIVIWAGPEYQAMVYGRSRPIQLDGDAQISVTEKEGGGGFEAGRRDGANLASNISSISAFVFGVCLPFLTGFAFGGAGYSSAKGRLLRKWSSLELLMNGKIFTRQVSMPIAAGALCGLAVAAVPYAVAMLFRGVPLLFKHTGVLGAPIAPVAMIVPAAAVPALGFFGFAFPAAERIRMKLLRVGAMALVAAVFVFGSDTPFHSLLPGMMMMTVALAIYFALQQKFDVLAAMAGMLTVQAVAAPSILLTQPASGLRDSGVRLLALVAAGIVAFVNFAIRGRDAESSGADHLAEMEIASTEAPSLSNRKRLEAEFQVARKAQQDALPATAPVVEGFSFSASCDPAQQVGGDLYDLFPLRDGRLGIAVADVSGKGVPAALYMMVTKGLLNAIVQHSSDLTHILQQINHHLYRACKRKVFVTMAAVVVEPASRRLEYARAGHNPIVWRRAQRGETLLRKPPGLGLGMCSSDRFGRSLRLEEMELEPGDAVVLYSDGVTEAINESMDQFGEERLMRSVEKTDGRPAEETRAAILRDLADFTAGTPARDDVTVVVLRVGNTNGDN